MITDKELYATTDASVWAKSFMEHWEYRKEQIDEGLMIAWFANAIETTRSRVQGGLR